MSPSRTPKSRKATGSRVLSMTNKNIQRREIYRNRDEGSRLREAVRLKRQHTIQHGKKMMQRTAWDLLGYEKQELLLYKIEDEIRDLFSAMFRKREDHGALEDLPGPKFIAEKALMKVLGDNTTLFGFGADESLPEELIDWA